MLSDLMRSASADILLDKHSVPDTFQGMPFQGSFVFNLLTPWLSDGTVDNEVRHHLMPTAAPIRRATRCLSPRPVACRPLVTSAIARLGYPKSLSAPGEDKASGAAPFGHDGVVLLLTSDEALPVEVQGRDGPSSFFIVCDHAGRLVPRSLQALGLSDEQLATHVAWDIGAAVVARRLGAILDAPTFLQRYSRLVIDCNRPLGAADSIVARSETTDIPGNRDVGPAAAEQRAQAIFVPYHEEIRRALDRRREAGCPTVLVSLHSFTPVFLGGGRPWHIGVLYNRDPRLATPLLQALRDEGDLVVGDNEPYRAGDLTDYTIVHHGEGRGLLHVELEIRQDLIASAQGQEAWASRLARLLGDALRAHQALAARPA